MQDGIYAKFNTSKGEILVKLTHDKTPGTVGNFVALAEGNLENEAKVRGLVQHCIWGGRGWCVCEFFDVFLRNCIQLSSRFVF